MDRLDALLRRFSVRAHLFHSGTLCAATDFPEEPGTGQLHLLRRGRLRASQSGHAAVDIAEPSLLFYPRPLMHRFEPDPDVGADLACARVRIADGGANPLADALPAMVVMPLADLAATGTLLAALSAQA